MPYEARLVVVLLLASPLACKEPAVTGAPPPASTAAPSPSSADAGSGGADAAPDADAPRVPDIVRSFGALHLPPIYLGSQKWLVLVGPPEVVHAAWVVGAQEASLVLGFPVATRVLGSVRRDDVTHLLLESLAALDQPAGLHAVVRAPDSSYMDPEDLEPELSGVADVATLDARLAAAQPAQPVTPLGIDSDPSKPVTAAIVAQHLAPGGADVLRMWQSTFTRPRGATVGVTTLASSPYGAAVVDAVRAAAAGTCVTTFCAAPGEMGSSALGGLSLDAAGRIERVYLHELPGPIPSPQPKVIAASPSPVPGGAATRAAMIEQLHDAPFQVVGEAPLTASGGTVGVAFSSADGVSGFRVVFAEGPYLRVMAYPNDFVEGQGDVEVRFVDADGDGRTDVVLRAKSSATRDSGPGGGHARAVMAPRTVNDEPDDYARDLAMAGAKTLDEAVQLAMAVPNRSVTRAEACGLLAKATTAAGFRAIAAPGAALVTFEVPAEPSIGPTFIPAARVRADDVNGLVDRCEGLACDPARPFCQSTHEGPGSEQYVFTWMQGALKLLYATAYRGT